MLAVMLTSGEFIRTAALRGTRTGPGQGNCKRSNQKSGLKPSLLEPGLLPPAATPWPAQALRELQESHCCSLPV